MWKLLLAFIFPKRCIQCRTFGSFLCAKCFNLLRIYNTFLCPICLKHSIDGLTHPICQHRYRIDGLFAGFEYGIVSKRLLYSFKYEPYLSGLRNVIGRLLCEVIQQNETFFNILLDNPLLIPVPLHPKKEKKRGYNQSNILCSYVAQYFSLRNIPNGLIRVKETIPQFKLNPTTRLLNTKNAFTVNKKFISEISGKTIIIVDDIATTCTTLRETARVLKRAGAGKVYGLTFAKEL